MLLQRLATGVKQTRYRRGPTARHSYAHAQYIHSVSSVPCARYVYKLVLGIAVQCETMHGVVYLMQCLHIFSAEGFALYAIHVYDDLPSCEKFCAAFLLHTSSPHLAIVLYCTLSLSLSLSRKIFLSIRFRTILVLT